jgi:arylformamidase
MEAARLIDISPMLSPTLPVWPGDTPLSREVLCEIEKGASVTLSTLRGTVHLGSHADGANHYSRGAPGIEARPLEHYIGHAQVIDAPCAPGGRVGVSDLRQAVVARRVLLRTGTFPDPMAWREDFAGLSVELVDFLATKGVHTIGVDTPSVDVFTSEDLPAHHAIYKHDISILEGLMLQCVAAGEYELIAPPLKLKDFDASPVRAVLREWRPAGGR